MDLVAFTRRNEGWGLERIVKIRLEVDHVRSLVDGLLTAAAHSQLRRALLSAANEAPDRSGTVPVKIRMADFEPLLRVAMMEYEDMAKTYVLKKGGYYKQQFAEGLGRALGVKMTLDNVGVERAPDTHGYVIDTVVDDRWTPEFVV
ncbi:hypothetical protein ACU4I5_00075 [Ensifer adhaerens]